MPERPTIHEATLPSGNVYDLEDSKARADIEELKQAISGGAKIIGETTTALTDGATTNPITINSESVTAVKGDLVFYNHKEFLWTGALWREMGDLSALGALAFKSSASGAFTPAGTISAPAFTGTEGQVSVSGTPSGSISTSLVLSTSSVTGMSSVGTLPSLTMSVTNGNLVIGFDAGTLPTKSDEQTFATGVSEHTATFIGESGTYTGAFTPAGTVAQPTFTGTEGTVNVS